MEKDDDNKQLRDILEIDQDALPLEIIDAIANDDEIRKIFEKKYGNSLYPIILKSLTHETFIEPEALALWHAIIDHMKQLNQIVGRKVGVAVASMDYLANIEDKLANPKIIEEEKISFIAATTLRDELTGLFSRDVFETLIKKEIDRASRNDTALCLLMIDIDDFKSVNDTHGHLKGDDVLNQLGSIINKSVRTMDVAARYGGEEFVIIMPNTDIEYAYKAAERIRTAIEKLKFNGFGVTISVGISEFGKSTDTPEKMVGAADRALYRAKKEGKNRTKKASDNDFV
ncbi:MAG: GGDEF domain-containing protein [Desulfobacterales bacterium]